MVEEVLDTPVPSDPGSELGAGGRAGRQTGDQVDALDGQLARAEVWSPARDLEGMASVGVAEVGEHGGLQPADLVAVVGPGALVVVECDLTPGQDADAVEQAGWFFFTTAM
ncbi:hypothetical protein ACH437_00505 [Streptomyces xinghaiensis]|uniref:hypothetical protein n=1 Tax=Streptomyces xinghaiensis TaxID=1038928 RepID=UPI0037B6C139